MQSQRRLKYGILNPPFEEKNDSISMNTYFVKSLGLGLNNKMIAFLRVGGTPMAPAVLKMVTRRQ